MGISGLLPLLQKIQKPTHIEKYRGQTIAIDGHCILHRGSYIDALPFALNEESFGYVNYFIHYIELLEFHNVTPIVVFDGLPLPIKRVTNEDRSQKREKALREGLLLFEKGDKDEALKYFRQSIKITPDMIRQVIMKLKKKKIEVIVAPYEADAQLAYLMKKNKVRAVITEDSDLLAFGCSKIIYKMNRYGEGTEINHKDVFELSELSGIDTKDKLRQMCILSGCDYLPSVKGVGLKTALKYFNELNTIDKVLDRIQFKHKMPKNYTLAFKQADDAFLYQWVYDIDLKQYVRFNSTDQELPYLGKFPSIQDSTLLRVNKIISSIPPSFTSQLSIDLSLSTQSTTTTATSLTTISTDTDTDTTQSTFISSSYSRLPLCPIINRYLEDKKKKSLKLKIQRYNSIAPYQKKL